MSEKTTIYWTAHTWNPWRGCAKVSPGCKNCYMFTEQRRYGNDPAVVMRTKTWGEPLKWQKKAAAAGVVENVFTCSWSDWFIEDADEWREEAWQIVKRTPNLNYQILTKRPENIASRLPKDWGAGYQNVWLGVSVEDQKRADERIPKLLETPAAIRFLSCEPLLGPLDLSKWIGYNPLHAAVNRTNRGVSLSSGAGPFDRSEGRRNDLEDCDRETQSLECRSNENKRGAASDRRSDEQRLSHGEDNAEQKASHNDGAQAGVQGILRTNTARPNSEPQERNRGSFGQQARKLGSGDIRGTDSTRDRSSGADAEGPGRREERHGEAYGSSSERNPKTQESQGETEINSQGFRNIGQTGFQDSIRATMEISWIIVGGESGPGCRPMDIAWARSIRDQCRAAGVPLFFKQSSGIRSETGTELDGETIREYPVTSVSPSPRMESLFS